MKESCRGITKGWKLTIHRVFGRLEIANLARFPEWLIFKNGVVGAVAFSGKEEIFTKIPLALF